MELDPACMVMIHWLLLVSVHIGRQEDGARCLVGGEEALRKIDYCLTEACVVVRR